MTDSQSVAAQRVRRKPVLLDPSRIPYSGRNTVHHSNVVDCAQFPSVVLFKLHIYPSMKFTRSQLICSTEKQLQALGVVRKNNAGWLRKAVQADFSTANADEWFRLDHERKTKRQRKEAKQGDMCSAALLLSQSMTKEQKEWLTLIAAECKKLGATSVQLGPIFAAIYVLNEPKNCVEMKHHEEVARQLEGAAEEWANRNYKNDPTAFI